jgi:hypothetical protein
VESNTSWALVDTAWLRCGRLIRASRGRAVRNRRTPGGHPVDARASRSCRLLDRSLSSRNWWRLADSRGPHRRGRGQRVRDNPGYAEKRSGVSRNKTGAKLRLACRNA